MRIEDTLWLGYKDLNDKRVRTALTIIMVVIGVASIVALVSLTDGISQSIQNSLNTLGPTTIIVTSAKATGFTLTDTAGISSLPNVSSVTPVLEGSGTVIASGVNTSVTVIGISAVGLQSLVNGAVNLYSGTLYNDTITPSSLVGYSIAFPSTSGGREVISPGQPVTLKIDAGRSADSYTIPVVGVMQQSSSLIAPTDTAVVMSMPAAEALLHRTSFNLIIVKAKNVSEVSSLATTLGDIYGNNAHVTSTQQIASEVNQVIGSITILLLIVAGISLLVAAIGIMNIMLMAVLERTHEIGIMKSLGFTNNQVLSIFLSQALIIGVFGGIVGIGVGMGGSYALSALASHASANSNSTTTSGGTASASGSGGSFRGGGGGGGNTEFVAGGSGGAPASSSSSASSLSFSPVLTLGTIIEALAVAIGVSAIAGIYPAWRASKMEPIEALRQL